MRRIAELKQHYVVLPALSPVTDDLRQRYPGLVAEDAGEAYSSPTVRPMDREELGRYLLDNGLLDVERGEVIAEG